MNITGVRFVPGVAAYYFDDQEAIRRGAARDGYWYTGDPTTAGFQRIREPGQIISVLLELESGQWASGDCCAVQYSGAGGRDPLFRAGSQLAALERTVGPQLIGQNVADPSPLLRSIDTMLIHGTRLHTAARYGISQAILHAAALAAGSTITEVVCAQYSLPLPTEPLAVFAQSGEDRYGAVDKMLLREIAALPHGLINNVDEKLGRDGEKLHEYVGWLCTRVAKARQAGIVAPDYAPALHIDVYGTLGLIFDHDAQRTADYLVRLANVAKPLTLYIEGPVDAGRRDSQIEAMAAIRERTDSRTQNLRLVADEWCNTMEDIRAFVAAQCCHMVQIKTPDLGSLHNVVDAVLHCRAEGTEAYQGGTCNETDISARRCTEVALACRPDRLLAKPGMGVDEGMQIVTNEMHRTLARLAAKTELAV